jgi:GGDEF domain-containing protein
MARVLIVRGHASSRADTAATLRAEGHDVLDRAQAALTRAERAGRNRCEVA